MMKIFVRISFYGKNFYGTQKQKEKVTIQGLFENLLSRIYNSSIKVTICSRLDRGVHALDYAFTFDIENAAFNLEHLKYYLTRSVGNEIFIKDIRIVSDDFSPRYSCISKQYLYIIDNGLEKNPLFSPFSYKPKRILDIQKLNCVLSLFQGTHDFYYFSTPEGDENTILDLDKVSLVENGDLIYIRFVGKSFLRYQVRFMVGAAISVCYQKETLNEIKDSLNRISSPKFKYKAEPQGLILEKINYPDIQEDSKRKPSLLF